MHYAKLLLWAGCAVVLASNSLGALKPGDAFPDLGAFQLEGQRPATLKGKVVLVDFWASWCEPCKASFPVMEQLQKKYGEKGLVIVAINEDEDKAEMEAFLKKNPVTFIVLRDVGQKMVETLGVGTMPTSFLLDPEGKVRFIHNGFRGESTKKKYTEEIEALLKK